MVQAFEAWPGEVSIIPSSLFPPVHMGEFMAFGGSIRHAVRLLPQAPVSL